MKYKTLCSLRVSAILLILLGTGCSKTGGDAPSAAREDAAGHEHAEGEKHVDGEKHGDEKGEHVEGEKHGEKKGSEGAEKHDEHEEGVVELPPEAFARANIKTATVEFRDLPAELATTGEVGFNQDLVAHVSPRIPGRIHKVHAALGATVKAGEPLATIDSIELGKARSEYLQANAQLKLAEQTLQREEKLLTEKIASEREVQEARAVFQKASAEFQAAEGQLRLYGLTPAQIQKSRHDDPQSALLAVSSPVGGVVTEKHVTLGELVSPEKDIFTVADVSRLWIWIDIYERNLAQVHKDDDVIVRVETYPDRVFRGKVAYIGDQVSSGTRSVRARVDVDNPDRALKPGMFVRVKLSDPHAADGKAEGRKVVAVPTSAIQRDGDASIAFVAEGERRFERRVLTLGSGSDAYVEVLSGLKVGEQVVIDGAFLLKSEAAKETMGEGHSH